MFIAVTGKIEGYTDKIPPGQIPPSSFLYSWTYNHSCAFCKVNYNPPPPPHTPIFLTSGQKPTGFENNQFT